MSSQERIESFVARIENLGGTVVWESDLIAVTLNDCPVTNEDLAVFNDYPEIEILSLAGTSVTDEGLRHLENLSNLTTLSLSRTHVTDVGANRLRQRLPNTSITAQGPPKGTINPFTGEPME